MTLLRSRIVLDNSLRKFANICLDAIIRSVYAHAADRKPRERAMDIILYYAPIACSLVPYVTLTEANAKFEVRPVNLRKGQQNAPEYLRLNPKHKVPVLVVDGRTLTENVAIQTW